MTRCDSLRRVVWVGVIIVLGACDNGEGDVGQGDDSIVEGDVLIANRNDVVRFAHARVITGDLVVKPTEALAEAALPVLTEVHGSVRVEAVFQQDMALHLGLSALRTVRGNLSLRQIDNAVVLDAPALVTVGGHLDVMGVRSLVLRASALTHVNGDLRVVDTGVAELLLTGLTKLGGGLWFERFSAVGAMAVSAAHPLVLAFPALVDLTGDIRLRHGPDAQIDLPSLKRVGGDMDLTALGTTLVFPQLEDIDGTLRLRRTRVSAVALDALRQVGGDVDIGGVVLPPMTVLTLPALATVGGTFEIHDTIGLAEVDLAQLASLGGVLRVERLGDLRRIHAPALIRLPTDVILTSCGGPLRLDLPAAERLGGSLIVIDQADVTVSLPHLTTLVGTLRLERVVVRALDVPALVQVDQHIEIYEVRSIPAQPLLAPLLATVGGSVRLQRTTDLRTLSLPSLVTIGGVYDGFPQGDFWLKDNQHLEDVVLPQLADVTVDVSIRQNPALDSTVVLNALASVMVGGTREICGNRTDGPVCP